MAAAPIEFSNNERWETPVLIIRDSWDTNGYRLYWTRDRDYRYCVQVDGEINGTVFRTIRDAKAYAAHRFPGVEVSR
jgi:hypothetical protein